MINISSRDDWLSSYNPHALAGMLALTKHTNDFDPDTDWEQTKKRLLNEILTTIN